MLEIEQDEKGALVRVRVQPKASRNAVSLEPDGRIRVALTAPPVEGAANKALLAFLSKTLGLPRRRVMLVRGERSRNKTVLLAGFSAADAEKELFARFGD